MVRQEFSVPDLGGADEGELVAWLVEPGEHVEAEQTIAEVETDKSLIEVSPDYGGELLDRHASAGDTVAVGDALATFEVEEGAAEPEPAEVSAAASEESAESAESPESSESSEPAVPSGRVFAPPRVRRVAREAGVDITTVEGSGPGGRVTEADVEAAVETQTEPRGPREFTGGTSAVTKRDETAEETEAVEETEPAEEPPSPRPSPSGKSAVSRRATGEAAAPSEEAVTSEATTPAAGTPPVPTGQTVHHDEADVTDLLSMRDRLAPEIEAEGGSLSALPFAVAAVASALRRFPALNGPIEGGEVDQREEISVAIGIPTTDGLVTPVVVDADDVDLRPLALEVEELVERARAGDLTDAETADATFTVTDFGALGGTYAAPDASRLGTGVLSLGAIRTLPRVRNEEVVPRDVVALSTTIPSATIDGTVAAQFTNEVRRYLTEPALLLL